MRPIMQHVASLAERTQVREPVVRGIAIKVGGGEHDTSGAQPCCLDQVRPACEPASPIAPSSGGLVEPTSVRQTPELCEVRAATSLALTVSTLEPHPTAQLTPMRRIEGA